MHAEHIMSKPYSKMEVAVATEAQNMTAEEKYARVLEFRNLANAVPQDGTKESATKWRKFATLRDIWEEAWLGRLQAQPEEPKPAKAPRQVSEVRERRCAACRYGVGGWQLCSHHWQNAYRTGNH